MMDKILPEPLSTATVLPEELALEMSPVSKRQLFFRGSKRKKDRLVGKELSLALLHKLCLVADYKQGLNQLRNDLKVAKGPFVVSFINAHCFNLCHTDPQFCSAILQSDLVFRDGKGMEILCKSVDVKSGVNMCGTDSIPLMLDLFKANSLALIGTREPFLSKAAEVLREKGNKIVLIKNGFHSLEEYVDYLEEIQPKIILLGMGMPKQEQLSALLKKNLAFDCLIINGGAIIDQLGQKISRAPLWMRKTGLEWLFRLMQEPRRLFKRYVIGNILFLLKVYEAAGRIEL